MFILFPLPGEEMVPKAPLAEQEGHVCITVPRPSDSSCFTLLTPPGSEGWEISAWETFLKESQDSSSPLSRQEPLGQRWRTYGMHATVSCLYP